MDGSSFSFNVAPGGEEWDHTTTPPTRIVHEVRDLFDLGPVTYPAYLDATVAARSLQLQRPQSVWVSRTQAHDVACLLLVSLI